MGKSPPIPRPILVFGFVKKFQVVPKFQGKVCWEVMSESSQKSVFCHRLLHVLLADKAHAIKL